MRHINLKATLTWRDVLQRVLLVLVTVTIIVWFMPREAYQNYKIELGKPWIYGDMTAPFDFPIYKSDAMLKAESDSVLSEYEPYYTFNVEAGASKVNEFLSYCDSKRQELPGMFKTVVANRLFVLYNIGIIDTKTPLGGDSDTIHALRVVTGKNAQTRKASELLTAKEAYEKLVNDESLRAYHDLLLEMNVNDYIVANVVYDKERSETSKQELLNSIPRASGVVQRGQKIIDRGTIVDEQRYDMLVSYVHESERRHQSDSQLSTTIIGEILFVLILMLCFTIFLSIFRSDYFENMRSVGMIYSLIVLFSLFTFVLVSHNLFHVYMIPFAMVPIFIRVFMDSRTAFMSHIMLILICACVLQHPLEFIVVELVAGLTAILSLRDLSSRSQLFTTAAVVTTASCLTNLAFDLISADGFDSINLSNYNYLFVCGIVLFCSYPLLYLLEKIFGYTSNITLIELSDMNKELLRRMSEEAPGTFNHSIQVANLAAEIARKLGAKAQLVRTGALYHDIGKLQNPVYFTENQIAGVNPHEQLTEIESAGIIISHVTEGLKLADKYNLPEVIKGFIATHHGIGKTKFFYVNYKNAHPDEEVDELLFTYPGPNPFTKEQAILMMADAIEAASRSMSDYSEQNIRQLVNKIIDSMVVEGYFRECPITFRDIAYSKTVLIEKLKTVYHTRVSYPELKK
jgi:putative nucleotidyltransferase with HDIG domain